MGPCFCRFFNSSKSIYVENSTYPANGQKDDIILPALNFSNNTNINLSFDVAYSLWTSLSSTNWSDTLQLFISQDCGVSFTKVWENLTGSYHNKPH